jgi:coenzyme F420-0:L-glutamate ligase/coenzyme F420-1:gamma-L-glutamate ligase
MSNVADALKSRRSIRKYIQRPVPSEILEEILNAATWAPSAHNAQPWRFIVLKDARSKRCLAEAMAETWLQYLKRDGVPQETRASLVSESVEQFSSAPVLVVACMTLEDMDQYRDEKRGRCERDLAVQSLAAAMQNMLLAAHAMGLGSCWYCAPVFCQKAVRQALGIPGEVEPQALIAFGYAAEKPLAPPRKSISGIAFLDIWGKSF